MTWEYYNCQLIRVIDGDTVVLRIVKDFKFEVDFGFYVKEMMSTQKSVEMTFRLLGIDTAEIVGTNKAQGLLARAELEKLLTGKSLRVKTYKPDSFGRWLAEIFTEENGNINELMIKTGYAVPYSR